MPGDKDDEHSLIKLVRKCTVRAIQQVFKILTAPTTSDSVRLRAAAKILLDRGWSKPAQSVAISMNDPNRLAQVQATLQAMAGKSFTFEESGKPVLH
jgi:hypothetical protein